MPDWANLSTGLKLVGTEDALRLPWALRPNEWPMIGRSMGNRHGQGRKGQCAGQGSAASCRVSGSALGLLSADSGSRSVVRAILTALATGALAFGCAQLTMHVESAFIHDDRESATVFVVSRGAPATRHQTTPYARAFCADVGLLEVTFNSVDCDILGCTWRFRCRKSE